MRFQVVAKNRRVPWGNLAWVLPLAYVFWAPYRTHAGWVEWALTTLALGVVLVMFLTALTFEEDRRTVTIICVLLLLVAITALAYRPSGGLYFCVAAIFVPASLRRGLLASLSALAAVAGIFSLEWIALYRDQALGAVFPAFVVGEVFLSGVGVMVAHRQSRKTQQLNRASERERIAKDLHDLLGHSLASLALKAELARRIFHTDPERALREISEVESIARDGLEDMRRAVHGYFHGDLYAELNRVEALLRAAELEVKIRCEIVEMPPATERVLALILREAVTNILRHANARGCELALTEAEGAYHLHVSDDGRGMTSPDGLGMQSIRTRAEASGGTAKWQSGATGTELNVSLPMLRVEPTQ